MPRCYKETEMKLFALALLFTVATLSTGEFLSQQVKTSLAKPYIKALH